MTRYIFLFTLNGVRTHEIIKETNPYTALDILKLQADSEQANWNEVKVYEIQPVNMDAK